MSEKEIENCILQYLNAKGIFAWKNQSVGIYDTKRRVYRKNMNRWHINGVSDIIGLLPDGKMLAIEVKTPKTKTRLTCAQKDFIDQVKFNKGIAFMAYSIDCVQDSLSEYL